MHIKNENTGFIKMDTCFRRIMSCCLVIIVSVILFFVFKIKFRYPDDYLITAIIGGAYGNGSNQYMIPFISVLLTWALSSLGNLLECFNMYSIFLFITLNGIFCILHTMFIKSKKDWFMAVLLVLMQIIFTLYLTFTVMAYLTIGTAFLWLYCNSNRGKVKVGSILLFVVMVILGVMFRPAAGISALLLMIPIVAFFVSEKKFKIAIASVLITCTCIFLIKEINTLVYQQDEMWQEYKEWNSASASIRDYARIDYDDYSELFEKVNWSEEDLSMIYAWTFIDQTKFDTESLTAVRDGVSTEDRYDFNPVHIAVKMIKQPTALMYIFSVILFLIILKEHMWKNWVGLLTAAIPLCAFTYLLIRQRFVERMAIPICLIGILELILFAEKCRCQRKNCECRESNNGGNENKDCFLHKVSAQTIRWLFALPLVVLLVIIGKWQYRMTAGNEIYAVKEYISENENDLFLTSSGLANQFVTGIPIVQLGKEDYLYNVVKLGSWDSFSGRYYDQLSSFDVEDMNRMFLSLAEERNIYLVVNDLKYAQYILDYIVENYDSNITYSIIETFGDIFVLEYCCGGDGMLY